MNRHGWVQGEKKVMAGTTQKTTLRDVLLQSAERWPNRSALSGIGYLSCTYNQLLTETAAWSSWLLALRLQKGDCVAVLSEPRAEWVPVFFGITAAGFVAVQISPNLAPEQISGILERNNIKAAISSSQFGGVMEGALFRSKTLPNNLPRARLETRVIIGGVAKGTLLGEPKDPHVMFDTPLTPDNNAVIFHSASPSGTSVVETLTHETITRKASAGLEKGLGPNPKKGRNFLLILPGNIYECIFGTVGVLSVGGEVKKLTEHIPFQKLGNKTSDTKPTVLLADSFQAEKIYRTKITEIVKANPFLKSLYAFPPARKIIHYMAGKKLMKFSGGNLRFLDIEKSPLPREVKLFLFESGLLYSFD